MEKPDPEKSKIRDICDIFDKSFQCENVELNWDMTGEPIFNENDPIMSSNALIDYFVKRLLTDDHVTLEAFTEMYRLYGTKVKGFHIDQANNNKSNTIKSLRAGSISIRKFMEVLRILGFSIDSCTLKLSRNGKTKTIVYPEQAGE